MAKGGRVVRPFAWWMKLTRQGPYLVGGLDREGIIEFMAASCLVLEAFIVFPAESDGCLSCTWSVQICPFKLFLNEREEPFRG